MKDQTASHKTGKAVESRQMIILEQKVQSIMKRSMEHKRTNSGAKRKMKKEQGAQINKKLARKICKS